MSRYSQRGVSASKEDVHNAIKNVNKGLFPGAFCKIIPDLIAHNKEYCNVMHADGAGTKSSLAYIYYKETGDVDVFRGIAMDSMVMNIDDLLCIGATNNFLVSSTIGRNSRYISGEVISTLINANEEIAQLFRNFDINVTMTGGETADVGDLVRTLIVDTTVIARMKRDEVIDASKIQAGDVIVGLSSTGQATYEQEWNGGIGSNGLTSARHDVFHADYRHKYPESYDPLIPEELAYSGSYYLSDMVEGLKTSIGRAMLSPTRTYAPVIKKILDTMRSEIHGIIHCSGGGQTKCLYFGHGLHYIKDNFFAVPKLFSVIQEESQESWREMYQVFNMGHRMEIYVSEKRAKEIISIAKSFNIDAQIIGHVEKNASDGNKLTLTTPESIEIYEK